MNEIPRCPNCGAWEDLFIDEDNDQVSCWQCNATWESIESFKEAVRLSASSMIKEET